MAGNSWAGLAHRSARRNGYCTDSHFFRHQHYYCHNGRTQKDSKIREGGRETATRTRMWSRCTLLTPLVRASASRRRFSTVASKSILKCRIPSNFSCRRLYTSNSATSTVESDSSSAILSHLSLPLIDVGPYLSHTRSSRTAGDRLHEQIRTELLQDLGRQVDSACAQVGFFTCVNHGVDPQLMHQIFAESQHFFGLPEPFKEKISIEQSPALRGYAKFGLERTLGKPDFHESVDYPREYPDSHHLSRAGFQVLGPNPWPDPERVPAFQPTISAYIRSMQTLATTLISAMAVGLGLSEAFFEQYFSDPFCILRLLRYPSIHPEALPALPAWQRDLVLASEKLGCRGTGEHTDFGCLTLLAQDDVGGLQVLRRSLHSSSGGIDRPSSSEQHSREWIPVNTPPQALVVNIGDMMETWTNGRYKATLHRVARNLTRQPPRARYSVAYFHEPNFDAVISPLDLRHLLDVHTPTFADPSSVRIHYGRHYTNKIMRSFDQTDSPR